MKLELLPCLTSGPWLATTRRAKPSWPWSQPRPSTHRLPSWRPHSSPGSGLGTCRRSSWWWRGSLHSWSTSSSGRAASVGRCGLIYRGLLPLQKSVTSHRLSSPLWPGSNINSWEQWSTIKKQDGPGSGLLQFSKHWWVSIKYKALQLCRF